MSHLSAQARAAIARASTEVGPWTAGAPVPVAIEDLRAAAREQALASDREEVAKVRDLHLGEHGILVRAYRPAGEVSAAVVHAHGGGFVFNDVEVHDALSRSLANRTGAWVLSVDYRRPPEVPFPGAVEDLDTVVAWLAGGGLAELGLAPDAPVAVHGDSAGGNLALVTALRHPGRFAALALVYPFLDPQVASASWLGAADAFGEVEARWYWEQYARTAADFDDPALAPLLSPDLHTLPPTLVLTAEHDPCRDEGEVLAARAAEAGVSVFALRLLGAVHGFYRHRDAFDVAEPTLRTVAGFLDQHLS